MDMDPINYTERVQSKIADGFSMRMRKNRVQPKDGSGALTVIEFSLTEPVKESLKNAIDANINTPETITPDQMANIVRRHLPPQVMDELKALAGQKAPKTIYVIHNLPEISVPDARQRMEDVYKKGIAFDRPYNKLIQIGIGKALGLFTQEEKIRIARTESEADVAGSKIHKHLNAVDMLGAVVSSGAPTRFTDMKSLLEAGASHAALGNTQVIAGGGLLQEDTMLFKDLEKHFPNWQTPNDMEIGTAQNNKLWIDHVQQCSQDVVLKEGSLVMWPNDGHIFHQGMPTPKPGADKTIYSRIVFGTGFGKPKQL